MLVLFVMFLISAMSAVSVGVVLDGMSVISATAINVCVCPGGYVANI